jgi:hypothetical protein
MEGCKGIGRCVGVRSRRSVRSLPVAGLPHLPTVVLCGLLAASCGRSPVIVLDGDLLDDLDLEDEDEDDEDDPVSGGCRKVDYLFVIDNSGSMLIYQRQLVESFAVFIEGVQQTQQSLESIHVGVVTTDVYSGNVTAEESCLALGGLVTATQGHNSSDTQCGPYAEGHNYMTEQDDLGVTFPCAAQVGTTGSTSERPLEALTSAVTTLSQPGECNDGFIRDDALLVAVIVSDEDDPGPADYRYEKLVGAKNGYADNVVVVGLILEPDTDCPINGQSTEGFVLASFIGMFTHSFVSPVCGDYTVAFQQAISVVEAACSDA